MDILRSQSKNNITDGGNRDERPFWVGSELVWIKFDLDLLLIKRRCYLERLANQNASFSEPANQSVGNFAAQFLFYFYSLIPFSSLIKWHHVFTQARYQQGDLFLIFLWKSIITTPHFRIFSFWHILMTSSSNMLMSAKSYDCMAN